MRPVRPASSSPRATPRKGDAINLVLLPWRVVLVDFYSFLSLMPPRYQGIFKPKSR